jgi:hypothetical protein
MSDENYPLLTEAEERQLEYARKPFYGLFGNSLKLRILEQLMADPNNCMMPEEMVPFVYDQDIKSLNPEGFIRKAFTSQVEEVFKELIKEGLLEICPDCKAYRVNFKAKRWVALTLLAFAGNDDSDVLETGEYGESMAIAMNVYLSGHKCMLMPFCIDGSSEFKEE